MFKRVFLGLALTGALVATPFAFAAYNGASQAVCTCCGNACQCETCICDANGCACDVGGNCSCTPACCSACCDRSSELVAQPICLAAQERILGGLSFNPQVSNPGTWLTRVGVPVPEKIDRITYLLLSVLSGRTDRA